MGLFKSIKNIFKKEEKEKKEKESDVKVYEEGLTKTRESFVSRLANLTLHHSKIDEEYFEELEDMYLGINDINDIKYIDKNGNAGTLKISLNRRGC